MATATIVNPEVTKRGRPLACSHCGSTYTLVRCSHCKRPVCRPSFRDCLTAHQVPVLIQDSPRTLAAPRGEDDARVPGTAGELPPSTIEVNPVGPGMLDPPTETTETTETRSSSSG